MIRKTRGILPRPGPKIKTPQKDAPPMTQEIIDAFHKLYYHAADSGGTWKNTRYRGVEIWKSPLDLWIYQEIIFETRPDIIIECGTAYGASALYLADMLDIMGLIGSTVITIDVTARPERPFHKRIEYLLGSSVEPAIVESIRKKIPAGHKVMAILDSDHSKQHVLAEMETYGPMVTSGCYMVVEDGNVNGHPVYPSHGIGPAEAIADFVPRHPEFRVDRTREKLLMTFNPGGYLKKG